MSGDAVDSAIAQVLQASLKELGITMKIQNVDASAQHDLTNKLQYEIAHSYWTMDLADPDELMQFALDPTTGGHSFDTGFNDAELISLVHQAQKEFDKTKRQALYNTIQQKAGGLGRSWPSSSTRPSRTHSPVRSRASRSCPLATTTWKTSRSDSSGLTRSGVVDEVSGLYPQAVGVADTGVAGYLVHRLLPDPPDPGRSGDDVARYSRHAHRGSRTATPTGLEQAGLEPVPDVSWGRLFHGNLGYSYVYSSTVTSLIKTSLPVTLWLLVSATFFSPC